MFNIIKMDLYKMFKSKIFHAMNIALVVIVLMTAIFMRVSLTRDYEVGKESSFGFASEVSTKMTNDPEITEEEYYLIQDSIIESLDTDQIIQSEFKSPALLISLSVFMSVFIGSEMESGFIKNIVPLSNSRRNLIVSKNIVAAFFSIIQTILAFGSAVLAIVIVSGSVNISSLPFILKYLSMQVLLMVGFSSFIILLSYLFKSKVVSLAIGFLVSFNVVSIVLDVVDTVFDVFKVNLSQLTIVGNSVLTEFSSNDYQRIILVFIIYFLLYNGLNMIRIQKMEIQ